MYAKKLVNAKKLRRKNFFNASGCASQKLSESGTCTELHLLARILILALGPSGSPASPPVIPTRYPISLYNALVVSILQLRAFFSRVVREICLRPAISSCAPAPSLLSSLLRASH